MWVKLRSGRVVQGTSAESDETRLVILDDRGIRHSVAHEKVKASGDGEFPGQLVNVGGEVFDGTNA